MPESKGFRPYRRERSDDVVSIGDIVDGLMRDEVFSRGMPVAELASRGRRWWGSAWPPPRRRWPWKRAS